ncbi:MAG: cupredoxin domain-containing protein [Rhodanobacter sp.]
MFRAMLLIASMLAVTGWTTPLTAAAANTPSRPVTTTAVHAHAVHVIVLDKMVYGPMPTNVHAGDIIEWVNHDIFEHSATARDGSFDVDLKPGATARITAKAGTFAFFCKFHPGMTGTVVVK